MRGALLLLLLTGCATTASGPAMPQEYKPTGEVIIVRNSATFDDWRVMNPQCNLRKRGDGTWAGTLLGQSIDVSVTENRISGVGLMFTREMKEDRLIITGQFNGQILRVELDQDQAMLRMPGEAYTFNGHMEGEGLRAWGPNNDLQLKGAAAQANPPWPQIAFALLAAR